MTPRVPLCAALLLFLPAAGIAAPSDDAAQCQKAAGSYLSGTVARAPRFQSGKPLKGVYLSHTHLTLKGEDGKLYDVAIDNVFANGYQKNARTVPPPLNAIHTGDKLELCGQLYSDGGAGIHWVHTNCGVTPAPDKPDGWVRAIDAKGVPGPNMEAKQDYCGLWPN